MSDDEDEEESSPNVNSGSQNDKEITDSAAHVLSSKNGIFIFFPFASEYFAGLKIIGWIGFYISVQ